MTATARLGGFSEPQPPEHGFLDSLLVFEDNIDRPVRVYRSYRSWGQKLVSGPVNHLLKRNNPPRLYLSVHAFLDSKGRNTIPWAEITAGLHDAVIDAWSAQLMDIVAVTPVYMCFHHEMENEEGKCGTPEEFQAAYWYFRHRVQTINQVPDLTWVITYMGNTVRGKHGGPERWWPSSSPYQELGPDQLMGIDLYNRNVCHAKGWRKFEFLADPAWQFANSVGRPMFIGECGVVESAACGGPPDFPTGSMKAEWYDDALVFMRDTAPSLGYTPLEAFCYSNVLGFNDGSYRIDTSNRAENAFRDLANDPFFSLV